MYWIGQFNNLKNTQAYSVQITPLDDEDYNYEYINLALDSPVTVTYNESDTLYSPIRTSTMQINVVYDDYLFEAFKNIATGTSVTLSVTGTGPRPPRPYVVWQGFLQNNLLNAGYEKCTESFSLQASDYLAIAQYIPYEVVGETKNIVTLKDILDTFLRKIDAPSGAFDRMKVYWPDTRLVNKMPAGLENIQISEFNFFSSDTDKAWNYQEVISEFAKYFGFTAMQWRDGIYFMDYEAFTRRDTMSFMVYSWNGDYLVKENYEAEEGSTLNITADDYTKNGGQISFQTPYNKIKVNDNFYDVDAVVPDIFDDDVIQYLYGGKNEVRAVVEPMSRPRYLGADTQWNFESEEKNKYYRKELVNPNFTEHWYKANESAVTKQQVDNYAEFSVNRWAEFNSEYSTTKYGWRWQCYYVTDNDNGHTEIGSYQDWQNGDDSKTFSVQFNGRYLWNRTWYADFQLSYYSASADAPGAFQFDADNKWHEYFEHAGDNHPVFWYCVDPVTGNVGFIPYDNDWRISTTYPIFSNVAPDYMPQIFQDVFVNVQVSEITGAGVEYTVFNYRKDTPRTFTATVYYADYSASTVFTVPAHQYITVTTNVNGTVTQDADRDSWGLLITAEDGASGATSWTRLEGLNVIYPSDKSLIKDWIGARIVEMASLPKKEANPSSDLSFTRYLLLAIHGSPLDKNNAIDNHLKLFELNSTTAPAVFTANGSFFYIQCNALFTRHWGYDYIGEDWAQDKSRIYHNDGGPTQNNAPALVFCFGIGDMYWNGTAWQNTKCNFKVPLYNSGDDGSQKEQKDLKCWNVTMPIKNQVGWEQWSSGEGYKIPFAEGVNYNGKITFEICTPIQPQAMPSGWGGYDNCFNGYCWLSNLKIGMALKNDEKLDNADVVYESVINEDSVNELQEISLRVTTYPKIGKLGYSHVGCNGVMIDTMADASLDAEELVPEAAIVQRYYNQYSTPTKKEYITLGMDSTPFVLHHDSYWDCDFAVIGQTIDYYTGQNTLSLEEIKKNGSPMFNVAIRYWMTPGTPEPDWWQQSNWETTVAGHNYDSTTGEGMIYFNDVVNYIKNGLFVNNPNLIKLELPYSIDVVGTAISGNTNMSALTCYAPTAPSIVSSPSALTNNGHQNGCVFIIPNNALGYDAWNNNWFTRLGSYWTSQSIVFAQSGATIPGLGGTYNVSYTYNGGGYISVSSVSTTGVRVNVQNGNMVYTVPENPSPTTARSITITITDSRGASATFTITQKAATYTLQQNAIGRTISSKGNSTQEMLAMYDGPTDNLTVSTSESWLTAQFGEWGDVDENTGLRTCKMIYSASVNRDTAERIGTVTVTDGVNSVSFTVTQQKPIQVSAIEVWYRSNSTWTKAPSYNNAQYDFLIPTGATYVIMRVVTTGPQSSTIMRMSQMSDYSGGGYASLFAKGARLYYWDNFPDSAQSWYFRVDEAGLQTNANSFYGKTISNLREVFVASRLWDDVNTYNNTVFGDGYKVLGFKLLPSSSNVVLSKDEFKIYLKA